MGLAERRHPAAWGARRVSFRHPGRAGALAWLARTPGLGNAAGVPEAFQQAVSRHGDADQPWPTLLCAPPSASASESTRLVSTVASWHPGPLGYVEPPGAPLGTPWSHSGWPATPCTGTPPDVAWEALTFLLAERAVAGAGAGAAPPPPRPPIPRPAPLRPLPTPGRVLFPLQRAADHRRAAPSERHQTGSKTWTSPRPRAEHRRAPASAPSPAPDAVWPVLAQALQEALQGIPALEALARAQDEAQKRLDGAWKSASSR